MKLYREYAKASISMVESPKLRSLLKDVISGERISTVIETGTYRGLGSTRFVSESFPKNSPPRVFVTIEVNWLYWCQAKWNLRGFRFVKPVLGRSIRLERALEFIRTDEVLREHTDYPDVFIDDTENPTGFYSGKIQGFLGKKARNPMELVHKYLGYIFSYTCWAGDDLLERYLAEFRETNPLIILDSAGGIGYLEFKIVEETMQGNRYILLLDDIHHLKHFRSYRDIRHNSRFEIIGADEKDGWLIAKHGF